jgi:hypothetical protein
MTDLRRARTDLQTFREELKPLANARKRSAPVPSLAPMRRGD